MSVRDLLLLASIVALVVDAVLLWNGNVSLAHGLAVIAVALAAWAACGFAWWGARV